MAKRCNTARKVQPHLIFINCIDPINVKCVVLWAHLQLIEHRMTLFLCSIVLLLFLFNYLYSGYWDGGPLWTDGPSISWLVNYFMIHLNEFFKWLAFVRSEMVNWVTESTQCELIGHVENDYDPNRWRLSMIKRHLKKSIKVHWV